MNITRGHWFIAFSLAFSAHYFILVPMHNNQQMAGSNGVNSSMVEIHLASMATVSAKQKKPLEVQQKKIESNKFEKPQPQVEQKKVIKSSDGWQKQAAFKTEFPVEAKVASVEFSPVENQQKDLDVVDQKRVDTMRGSAIAVELSKQAKEGYKSILGSWLAKFKRYPRKARRKNQQGRVMLKVSVDQLGRLLDYEILESSKYRLLDVEAKNMLVRASPLPSVPDGILDEILILKIPVEFDLRNF